MRLKQSAALIISGLLVVAHTPNAVARSSPALRYTPFAVSNAVNLTCYRRFGLYVSLNAKLPGAPTLATARRTARKNRPINATAQAGATRYRLAINNRRSGSDRTHVWWDFRAVGLSRAKARVLVGRKLRVTYRYPHQRRQRTTRRVRVVDGDCTG